ncbi:hypothetical protein DFQ28_005835 [Apophysomyces sp. BC1034]|nr:hypothetical protein DFQ28_005835 [Apophysomyces sp. BC1034]
MGGQTSKEETTSRRRTQDTGRRQHLPQLLYDANLIVPIRHQLVLADRVSPISSLSAAINFPGRRRSYTSSSTSDDTPPTPTLSLSSIVYDASVQSLASSPSWPISSMAASAVASAEYQMQINPTKDTGEHVCEYGEEKERDRQLRQHYLLKQVFHGNIHVPLKHPKEILDCACGAGLWALETAQTFPECTVTGIDVALPREHDQFKGVPNLRYIYGDFRLPLGFADNTFDFIYQRDVAIVAPSTCWPNLIAEFGRVLKSGGYLQLVEYDLFFRNPGPVLSLVNEWYKIAAAALGVNPYCVDQLPHLLESAGFECKIQVFDIPIGEWPEDLCKNF